MLTKLQKWGNSQGVRFTKAILDEAQIRVGDQVNVSVRKGRIIVEPVRTVRGKYDLKELVSKLPEDYRTEELDWGPPVGKETWYR
jgi:antitoxin MazE